MDQSEIKFKYRKGSTNVSIPYDKLSKGEYYVNTSSSFMYLRTLGTDGLLFPGVIYDAADTDAADGLVSTDTYKGNSTKKYLIFHKYGSNIGRFVPGDVSSICIARADLAEVRNGKIQVKVRQAYIDEASSSLQGGSPVLAVIGYTDDSFKVLNHYGSSSMVRLKDIDSNGYATIDYVVSGYLLMKSQPSDNDILNYGVPGMAWHFRRDDILFEDGSTVYGNVVLAQVTKNSKYVLEVYSPYRSICDKAYITVETNKLHIDAYSAHQYCQANIYVNGTNLSILERLHIALAWRPSPYGYDATYKNGKKFYPAKPTSGYMGITLGSKDRATLDNINAILFGGQLLINTQEAINYYVYDNYEIPDSMVKIFGGIDIKSNMVDTEMPVYIAPSSDSLYVPFSLIHGGIYDNCNTDIKDNGSYSALKIVYGVTLRNIDTTQPLCHIYNIIYCDAETINGGEAIENLESESGVHFLMIDYQRITPDENGSGITETATLRKYYRLNGADAANFYALQNVTISISDKQYGS